MKVLYWTQLFWPYVGGVEVLASRLLPEMRKLGYELYVITSHGSLDLPDREKHNGTVVHRFPFVDAIQNRDIEMVARIRSSLTSLKQQLQPDLVHVNMTDPSIFFHWQSIAVHPAKTLVSTRVALSVETASPETLIGRTLRAADWITTVSKTMLSDIHRLLPETKARSSFIYNALLPPSKPPLPLNFEKPRLLCLGRTVEEKGFDVAIRALPQIRKACPDVELVVAGDGPGRPKLEVLAAELRVADVVHFSGWVKPERVDDLINSTTIVLMPSRWREAFGLVALQAAQLARPVIATRVGGLPEVVAHNETGVLIPNEDHEALVRAVVDLLENPEKAKALGENGLRRSKTLFDWNTYVKAYDSLYRSLID